MYIDGNIHSNEIQGSEFALYAAWYLAESFADTKHIQELLADKTFYIAPTINPDARDNFFHKPNNASSPRSGMIPVDNDRDGAVNEDGFDDLDGDGHIVFMRRKNPNGRLITDQTDPRRMISVGPDQQGEYELLGYDKNEKESRDNRALRFDDYMSIKDNWYTFLQDMAKEAGLNTPRKTGCYFCPYQRKAQWLELYTLHNDLFDIAQQIEDNARERFKGDAYYFVRDLRLTEQVEKWLRKEKDKCSQQEFEDFGLTQHCFCAD
jgi:hypothetical protein